MLQATRSLLSSIQLCTMINEVVKEQSETANYSTLKTHDVASVRGRRQFGPSLSSVMDEGRASVKHFIITRPLNHSHFIAFCNGSHLTTSTQSSNKLSPNILPNFYSLLSMLTFVTRASAGYGHTHSVDRG